MPVLPIRSGVTAALSLTLALAAGCASAPASAPKAAPVVVVQPGPPRISLICQAKAAAARFEELGVPKGEKPVEVALGKDAVYVLFRPARLLRITHKEGKMQAETAIGKPGEIWTAMDVDPLDGSVWLASDRLSLLRISPEWKTRTVKIQRAQGSGGFQRLLVAPDAIYAAPACAEAAVWRIDRDGKVLGTSFPIASKPAAASDPASSEPMRPEELSCSSVRLERDAGGRILAWDPDQKTLQRADDKGVWSTADSAEAGFFQAVKDAQPNLTVAKGMAVGTRDEAWYATIGFVGDLFWWKGKPAFLGPVAHRTAGGVETLLFVSHGEGVKEVVENCYGAVIVAIATTPTQYAAVTWNVVILGDFATAPDLP
jgi:hypothetical protein